MRIIKSKDAVTSTFYGMQCRSVIEAVSEGSVLPFGSSHCVVEPSTRSEIHNHHENECFFIVKGSGLLSDGQADGERVDEGDVVRIPPFTDHTLENDGSDPLHYLSFWWEDLPKLTPQIDDAKQPSRSLIFSTPPTPNGDLHLGHLSGPYTGADIYRRFLELKGTQAFHATGRDDNQSYVPRKAIDQKRQPAALADDYSARMRHTLARNHVRIDHFGHPGQSPYHVKMVQNTVESLYEKGWIVPRETEALFCRETGRYLYEAHVRGRCPHCDAQSDGNACEQCGRPNDVADLLDPQSKYGVQGVERRTITRLYFRMSAFAEQLATYHRSVVMPAHLAAMCQVMLDDGLPDICVSHPVDWGIHVTVTGFEDHRIYVWFEMAAGYLAAAQELAEAKRLIPLEKDGWKLFYQAKDAEVVHFFGFDNGYFHALLFPAVYMALGWDISLPKAFVVNELLNLNGEKFSTSRGHLIWGVDLLEKVPADYVRFYLSKVRPETSKTNFTMAGFVSEIDVTLRGTWHTWLASLVERITQRVESKIPSPGAWTVSHRAFFDETRRTFEAAQAAYSVEDFSPQRVCALATQLVLEAQRFADAETHYAQLASAKDFVRTGLALELRAAKALALIIAPVMPKLGAAIWGALMGDALMQWDAALSFPEAGRAFALDVAVHFPAIPESVYELQR